jgi:hypothetical protein
MPDNERRKLRPSLQSRVDRFFEQTLGFVAELDGIADHEERIRRIADQVMDFSHFLDAVDHTTHPDGKNTVEVNIYTDQLIQNAIEFKTAQKQPAE